MRRPVESAQYRAIRYTERLADLEFAVAEYIDRFNHRRLHGEIGLIPPVEAEAAFHTNQPVLNSRERD
ncbi:hypothetical protein [Cryobacterium sp. GrIS_2_6]|uniref:hypothetical protein n=1 Tax=Cryobacterium sp. GrIS_2_6 TaxID=3162785 RepID=UPI002E168222